VWSVYTYHGDKRDWRKGQIKTVCCRMPPYICYTYYSRTYS